MKFQLNNIAFMVRHLKKKDFCTAQPNTKFNKTFHSVKIEKNFLNVLTIEKHSLRLLLLNSVTKQMVKRKNFIYLPMVPLQN